MKKTAQWKTWAHILSLVLLKGRLAEQYYSQWIALTKAFRMATNMSITRLQLKFIETTIFSFVQHYEEEYYQFKHHRLSVCKPVIHALLHVAQCIKEMGPMWCYGQWTMERMVGLWTPKVKLRSNADRNLSLAMLHTTEIYSLSLATNLDFKASEDNNIDPTEDDLDGLSSSRAWQDILSRIQVYNGKKEEPDFGTSKYIQSPYQLATLHFPKGIRSLTVPFTKALLEYFDSINISISALGPFHSDQYKQKSEFIVENWSHCRLNRSDQARAVSTSYTRCQKYQKKSGKDSTHIRYSRTSIAKDDFQYAQVQFYFSFPVYTNENGLVEFLLALVTSISVIEQGGLSKIDHRRKIQITVINVDDIIGLVGLVKRSEDTYVVY